MLDLTNYILLQSTNRFASHHHSDDVFFCTDLIHLRFVAVMFTDNRTYPVIHPKVRRHKGAITIMIDLTEKKFLFRVQLLLTRLITIFILTFSLFF